MHARRCKCLNPRSIRKKLAGTNVTQESRSLTLGSYTVNQGNQRDTVRRVKSPVSCNPFDVVHALLDIRIRILCGGKRRFLTGRGGQRTRVDSIGGCPAVSAPETAAGPTPDDLEPRTRLDSRPSRPTACRRPSCCPWSSAKGDCSALVVSWGRRWELACRSPTG